MKRFPHTAIVTLGTGGQKIKGEWVPGEPIDIIVKGLFCWSNSGQQVRKNRDGNEFIVRGEFSTKRQPTDEDRKSAKRIRIESIGIDLKIEDWEPYQKHSVIYV